MIEDKFGNNLNIGDTVVYLDWKLKELRLGKIDNFFVDRFKRKFAVIDGEKKECNKTVVKYFQENKKEK